MIVRASAYGDMVECCNNSCVVKWFHLCCMSLTTAVIGIVTVNMYEKNGKQDRQPRPVSKRNAVFIKAGNAGCE